MLADGFEPQVEKIARVFNRVEDKASSSDVFSV